MIYLITGSRRATRADVWSILDRLIPVKHRGNPDVRLMHGAALGADQHASMWAARHNVYTLAQPALWQWNVLGKAAGRHRNAELLRDAIDLATIRRLPLTLIAMPGPRSIGTWDMIRRFKDAAGIWGGPTMTVIQEDVSR